MWLQMALLVLVLVRARRKRGLYRKEEDTKKAEEGEGSKGGPCKHSFSIPWDRGKKQPSEKGGVEGGILGEKEEEGEKKVERSGGGGEGGREG